ncbi:MAG: response regulator [Nibricoccus sp.]
MDFRNVFANRLGYCLWPCWIFLAWFVTACTVAHAVEPDNKSKSLVISKVSQFWEMTDEEKLATYPVRMELLVYYYDTEWNLLWGECGGSHGFVPSAPDKPLPIKSGQRYLVEGTVIPAKGLSADSLKFNLLPEAKIEPVKIAEITNDGQLNSRLVTLEGYINHAMDVTQHHWRLELISNGHLVTCNIWHDAAGYVPYTPDSLVRVTGLYLFKSDPTGLMNSVDLWVGDPSKVEIVGTLKDDARFNLPTTPIERLPQTRNDQLICVRGHVRRFTPGREVVIRDNTGQLVMKTTQARPLKVGDEIEAIGYTWINGTEWTLRRGLYRASSASAAKSPEANTLRVTEQILELTPEQAAQGYPVQIRGVVLWSSPAAPYFILKDSSGGVRVYRENMDSLAPGVANDLIVTGVTTQDSYVNAVRASRVDSAGSLTLPEPRPITIEQALTGVEENQWVEMMGYVLEVRHDGFWHLLTLTAAGGEFTARVPYAQDLEKLTGAVVRVQGVCTGQTNTHHELNGIQLQVPWAYYIQIEEPLPAEPFNVPTRSISSLHRFSAREGFNRRLRFTGVVLLQYPGRQILIQNGDEILHVQSRSQTPVFPGDLIEVVGLPGRQHGEVVLRESIYRKIGTGRPPVPVVMQSARNLLEELDDRLVKISGILIEKNIQNDKIHFVLQTKDAIFEANLRQSPKSRPEDDWELGSLLNLTGIYELEKDEFGLPHSFSLHLRTPADIAVISQPPWWNISRVFTVSGVVFGGALLVVIWVVALKRRVKKQTVQIRLQLEKEAHLEAQYREIFESASDFIFTVDLSGRFTSFNTAGEKMTGYSREQALRMNFRELLHPEDIQHSLPHLSLKDGNGGTVTFQSRFSTRTGGVTWAETNIQLILKAGVPIGMLGVVRDINERKQIENTLREARDMAEATTRAKSAFLANMSHEIRTPMNGVIGMSNLLLDTKLTPEQRDLAGTVKHSAESLLTILNDILDFSKIEAGKLQFDTADFDLREMIDGTLELVAPRAHEKGLELGALVPYDLPCALRGDPGRLRQVILNLLSNAVKFTDKGDVYLSVSLEEETELGVRLRFKIADTGIGLSEEARARLFKPFSQADETTTRKYGGTGLGLAISKQIVELMDGAIGVDSTPGEGSAFWFTALFAKQQGRAEEPLSSSIARLKDIPVLIVDQQAITCRILQHYLTVWQMKVHLASTRQAALGKLGFAEPTGSPIQILLVSQQLQDCDGIALAREIHQLPGPSGRHTLLLTTGTPQLSKEERKTSGIVDYLGKPIRQGELLSGLLRTLSVINGSRPAKSASPTATPPTPSEPEPTSEPKATAKILRILIAEDNIVNQRVTTMQLKKYGHKIEVVGNGLEVLEAIEKSTYDVILMDCQMPELDGYETTRRIRQNPRFATQWIIAMTANAMIGDRETCLDAGMNDYIPKPTRPQDLAIALARCPASQDEASRADTYGGLSSIK